MESPSDNNVLSSADGDSSGSSSHSDDDDTSELMEEDDSGAAPPIEFDYTFSAKDLHSNSQASHDIAKRKERIETVGNAANQVLKVIQKYGEAPLPSLDPNDFKDGKEWKIDEDSPWADTSSAMKEIVDARENLVRAWGSGNDLKSGSKEPLETESEKKKEWWQITETDVSSTSHSKGTSVVKRPERNSDVSRLTEEEQGKFQQVYMEWAADAFSDELEALRTGQLESFVSTSSGGGGKGKSGLTEESPSMLDLDPTQHSFVVSSNLQKSKSRGEADQDEEEEKKAKAAAAAAEIDVEVLADILQSGSQFLSVGGQKMLLRARERAEDRQGVDNGANNGETITLHERRRRDIGLAVS